MMGLNQAFMPDMGPPGHTPVSILPWAVQTSRRPCETVMLPTLAHFPYRVSSRTCWWGCLPSKKQEGTLLFCSPHEGARGEVPRARSKSEQREHQALVSGVGRRGRGLASSPVSKLCELSVESLLCLLSWKLCNPPGRTKTPQDSRQF